MSEFDTGDLAQRTVEATPDAVIFADTRGVIHLWNEGATRIFGFTAEETLGQTMDMIIPERLRQRHWDAYYVAMETGKSKYGPSDLLAVPAMRKDFLVDGYQVLEGRVAGAGGVLAILRMLPRPDLEKLIDTALELDMFVLLEAFDMPDIELAHALVDARHSRRDLLLVGVNSRDLTSLQVVPGRLDRLAASLPTAVKRVAESGVASAADAARVASAGYDLALVGSALMSAADPAVLARAMLAEGRAAVAGRAPRAEAAV